MRYFIPFVVLFPACGAPEPRILFECPKEMTSAPAPTAIPAAASPAAPVAGSCEPGDEGATGPQGFAGQQGPQGLPGDAGPRGATGANGAPGAQGPQGLQGPQGERGPQGGAGVAGPQGYPGPKGDPGRDSTLTHWTFEKGGNNGTVSCDTFCGGAQWGRTGTCIGAKIVAGPRNGEYTLCSLVSGEGNHLRCACTNFD